MAMHHLESAFLVLIAVTAADCSKSGADTRSDGDTVNAVGAPGDGASCTGLQDVGMGGQSTSTRDQDSDAAVGAPCDGASCVASAGGQGADLRSDEGRSAQDASEAPVMCGDAHCKANQYCVSADGGPYPGYHVAPHCVDAPASCAPAASCFCLCSYCEIDGRSVHCELE